MKKYIGPVSAAIFAVFMFSSMAQSQENPAQNKALARLAAIKDAQRTLSEVINGIYISGETTVQDYVATNDTIKGELTGFIQGAEVVKESYAEEIYEVMMRIDVARLTQIIGKAVEYDAPVIEVTGKGAAPGEKKIRPPLPKEPPQPSGKAWYEQVIRVVGKAPLANDPSISQAQRKLEAERAAKMDAYRNLIELIKGVQVDSKTTIQDLITQDDTIMSNIQAFVRGARVVNSVLLADGIHELTLEISLKSLRAMIE